MLRTPTPYRTPAQRDQDFHEQQRLEQVRLATGEGARLGLRLAFRTGAGAFRHASTADLEVVDENETQIFSLTPENWAIVKEIGEQLFEYAQYQAMGIELLRSCCTQALEFLRQPQYAEIFNGVVIGEIRHYDNERDSNYATRVIRHFEVKPEGTETLPSRNGIAVIVDPDWTDMELLQKQLERFIDATELPWHEPYQIVVISPPTPSIHTARMVTMGLKARHRHIFVLEPVAEYDTEQAQAYVDMVLVSLREQVHNPALVVFTKNYQEASLPLINRAWHTAQRERLKVYHIKP